jgi:hypothetical protein
MFGVRKNGDVGGGEIIVELVVGNETRVTDVGSIAERFHRFVIRRHVRRIVTQLGVRARAENEQRARIGRPITFETFRQHVEAFVSVPIAPRENDVRAFGDVELRARLRFRQNWSAAGLCVEGERNDGDVSWARAEFDETIAQRFAVDHEMGAGARDRGKDTDDDPANDRQRNRRTAAGQHLLVDLARRDDPVHRYDDGMFALQSAQQERKEQRFCAASV